MKLIEWFKGLFKKKTTTELLNSKIKSVDLIYTKRYVFDTKTPMPMDIRDFVRPSKTLSNKIALKDIFETKIKYVSDNFEVNGILDFWQLPEETIALGAGDCLCADTLLLKDNYDFIPISDIKIGDYVAGMDGEWTRVNNKLYKGKLPLLSIKLSNGCFIKCTKDHKLLLNDKSECLASNLKMGDILLNPDTLPEGKLGGDKDYFKLVGLHIADGWIDDSKQEVSISGKDGCPKEKQKLFVKEYCEKHNLKYYWNERYISIHSKELYNSFIKYGKGAKNKQLDALDFNKETAEVIVEGLNADSSYRNCRVYRTISDKLALQYRVLNRILGNSTHLKLIEKHGGFGKNPIWELNVRKKGSCFDKLIVREIKETEEDEVFDISTENKGIYLVESDAIVHNCDDSGAYKTAKAISCGYNYIYSCIGFYNGDGHFFSISIDGDVLEKVGLPESIMIIENTTNEFKPIPYVGSNYKICYIFNNENCWEYSENDIALSEFNLAVNTNATRKRNNKKVR